MLPRAAEGHFVFNTRHAEPTARTALRSISTLRLKAGQLAGLVLLVAGILGAQVSAMAQSSASGEGAADRTDKRWVAQKKKPANDEPVAPVRTPAAAKPEADAQAAQNPISNMISIPFQNNTYFDAGPYRRAQNVMLVEPVVPVHLNADWNLVTRWITPVIYQPRLAPFQGAEFGVGNVQPQFYFVPAHTGSTVIGFGPQFQLPTATDNLLGVNKWGAGPALAALTIQGPWVVGVLANNMWAGTEGERVNRLTLNPFVNYNMAGGWYLSSSPVLTADWLAPTSQRWTVPIGGGIGRVFKVGEQAVNARVQLFDNVVRPINAASWILQMQVQLLFPSS
ncbi:hypothetical protein [Bradyrhizobium genosp. A]|uniref:hypothetical protein n=1 Tax=Bradyrhizobium genosp. A TaxID=83626 RepID=UPI003CEE9DD4